MKIYFIGIGGIGVSALAQYYLAKGYEVSGSDLAFSEVTETMRQKGAKVLLGNKAEHIRADVDLVVYSPAVKPDNPELIQAKIYNLKAKTYPEALGELTRQYKTIAVSGSHGKSTTTSMIGLLMVAAGMDPTVIVGTRLKEFGNTNFRAGQSRYLVIEACEYDGSFLHYRPHIAVITNVDREHLDYFRTFAGVKKAFKDFIKKIPGDGWLVYNKDDKNIAAVKNSVGYSLRQAEAKKIRLKIPGKHNISNALAALSVARILGTKDSVALKSLAKYEGSWRRFEVKKSKVGKKAITVISDYAHHPTEIAATLKAAREKFPKKKIWLVFQPHQHQRTHYLLKDFVKLFKKPPVDRVIVTDIYDVAGRETGAISNKTSAEFLVKKISNKNVRHLPMAEAERHIKENIKSGEVLVIMGAGDVYKLYDKF